MRSFTKIAERSDPSCRRTAARSCRPGIGQNHRCDKKSAVSGTGLQYFPFFNSGHHLYEGSCYGDEGAFYTPDGTAGTTARRIWKRIVWYFSCCFFQYFEIVLWVYGGKYHY